MEYILFILIFFIIVIVAYGIFQIYSIDKLKYNKSYSKNIINATNNVSKQDDKIRFLLVEREQYIARICRKNKNNNDDDIAKLLHINEKLKKALNEQYPNNSSFIYYAEFK
ncbi:hypothetical protein [Campylobacter lari]|uniref:hypothetical protein n=1 Tax=Campylobacter lari TaxID=201 RepID=UPI000874BD28|nr:hypothetical protein [Campylobacter lari]EAK0768210.1 hypothetical protein [Campylobacter lari]EDP6895644.1 hypothetical protein [Campylobacter lari]MCV3399061.1 hypothetical protein [Campylobacter lari]MCV3414625.1 hypothetical protein [Campylobacter lari]MCV3481812.1 hypothetical protein [Campylobacter lari]